MRYALNLGSVSKYMACTHLNGDTIIYGGATSVFRAIIIGQLDMLRAQTCHVWNMSEFSLSTVYKTHLIAMKTLGVVEFGKTVAVFHLIPGCFINSCSAISLE